MTSTRTDSSSAHSTPPSPATTMSTHTNTATSPAVDNSLDDIFGSSPPPETTRIESAQSHPETASAAEPSDLPSLRRQHVTAGYRDGVSTSKGQHVQRGFDAGFPIGAQLGMRAGTVLGILEGIIRGLEDRSSSGVVKKPVARGGAGSASPRDETRSSAEMDDSRRRLREQVLKVYGNAVKALDVQAVFTGFEAGTGGESGGKARESESAEVQLRRKGDVVVAEWEGRVAVPRWEENMETLEMKKESESQSQSQGDGEGDKGAAGSRS